MRLDDIDKSVSLRQNPDWRQTVLESNETLILPMWRNCNLLDLTDLNTPKEILIPLSKRVLSTGGQTVLLGVENEQPLIAVDFSHLEENDVKAIFLEGEFIDLLDIHIALSTSYGSIMSYARGVLHWNRNSNYCGKCGTKTKSGEFGHIRICQNTSCENILYPRLEPAIIVLLEHIDSDNTKRCLLARHVKLPQFWTTLAGFVELGEQIEEAVGREVFEEVGLNVSDVNYVSSQPWPFPSSLMLGFTAKTSELEVTVDKEEIEEARWFSRQELKNGLKDGSITIPGDFSIAFKLIHDWLRKG